MHCVNELVHAPICMCTQSILLQFLITGFEDIAKACCGTGFFEMGYMCSKINPFTCSDVNKYVFWDSFHPTEKTNWIIADHVVRTSLATFLWRSQSIMQHLMVVVLVLIIHNSICWYLSYSYCYVILFRRNKKQILQNENFINVQEDCL